MAGGMNEHWFVDPADRALPLRRDGDALVSTAGRRYPIVNGIPRFVESRDASQAQTAESFGYKWNRQPDWGVRGDGDEVIWSMARPCSMPGVDRVWR
jgi:hypothetical protein